MSDQTGRRKGGYILIYETEAMAGMWKSERGDEVCWGGGGRQLLGVTMFEGLFCFVFHQEQRII